SPVPDPARAAVVGDSTSNSDEDWGNLELGIDLGPEPSLTEGLQSRKKKTRSSTEIAADAPSTAAAAAAPTPLPPSPPAAPGIASSPPPKPGALITYTKEKAATPTSGAAVTSLTSALRAPRRRT